MTIRTTLLSLMIISFALLFQNCNGFKMTDTQSKNDNNNNQSDDQTDNNVIKNEINFVGLNDLTYNYAPSVIFDNGTRHMWTCSNTSNPGEFRDVISYFIGNSLNHVTLNNSDNKTSWDGYHVCDPSIIKTKTLFNGQEYQYLMAYLGEDWNDANGDGQFVCHTSPQECSMHNQTGVAFSNSLAGPWIKFDKPILPFSSRTEWGIGQPSLIKKSNGNIVLFYTQGDKFKTSVYAKEYSFLEFDINQGPKLISGPIELHNVGLINSHIQSFRNADFVLSSDYQTLYMLRASDDDSFIQIGSINFDLLLKGQGSWTTIRHIDRFDTHYPLNHNAGFAKTVDGHLPNPSKLTLYITSNPTTPTRPDAPRVEWDYEINEYSFFLTPAEKVIPEPPPPPPPPKAPEERPIVITSPLNHSIIQDSGDIRFEWSYSEGLATQFWIDLSDDPNFSWFWNTNLPSTQRSLVYSNAKWNKGTPNSPEILNSLTTGKKYYLRVTGFNGNNVLPQTLSQTTEFYLTSSNPKLSISWSYSGSATHFWVDISEDSGFTWFWNKSFSAQTRSVEYDGIDWFNNFNVPSNAPPTLKSGVTYSIRITPFIDANPEVDKIIIQTRIAP